MLLEAKGLWAEAEKAYASLLEENPFDQVIILTVLCEQYYISSSSFLVFCFFRLQCGFNAGIWIECNNLRYMRS